MIVIGCHWPRLDLGPGDWLIRLSVFQLPANRVCLDVAAGCESAVTVSR